MTAEASPARRPEPDPSSQGEGDPLVTENLGLVYDLAAQLRRDHGLGPERGDLIGAGVRGLIQAARGFDASRGLAFSTFAVARIRGAMLDELRRWDSTPRSVRRKQRRIRTAEDQLRAELGREPTRSEVGAEIGIAADELHRWQLDISRHSDDGVDTVDPERLAHRPAEPAGAAPTTNDVIDRLGHEEAVGILQECLLVLPEREQRVLALYYFEELRLREIAQLLGVTESRVSQIRHASLAKLRSILIERGVEP